MTVYNGRLAADGDGNLLSSDGRRVAYDTETGTYGFVKKGGKSHNELHHKRDADVTPTSDPLYNAEGELVIGGEPHHKWPSPDDPHYNANAKDKTEIQFHDDEDAPTVTGHTAAYV